MTKSPPLSREGVETLLQSGQSLVSGMFGEEGVAVAEVRSEPLPVGSVSLPLRSDDGGVLRVRDSRISLDLIVEQYENGMTPEEMVRAYDTLALGDAYAAIAYYLWHRDAVQAYLKRRGEEAEALRAKIEGQGPRVELQKLLMRCGVREKDHAAAGE